MSTISKMPLRPYGSQAKAATTSSTLRSDAAQEQNATAPAGGTDRPPSTTVKLSDHAKALLEHQKLDQAVADWLSAVASGDGKLPKQSVQLLDDVLTTFQAAPEQLQKSENNVAKPTETITISDGPAPYGDPSVTDEEFIAGMADNFAWAADYLDKNNKPEAAQALRDAVQNKTLKLQNPSDIPGLNFQSKHTFTPSRLGGGYDCSGGTSCNPTGAAKELREQGRLMFGWSADRGNFCFIW